MPLFNQSVERMGASRSGQFQFVRHRRLAPTAHARRWAIRQMRMSKHIVVVVLLLASINVCFGSEADLVFIAEWTFPGPGGRYGIQFTEPIHIIIADKPIAVPVAALLAVVFVVSLGFLVRVVVSNKAKQS
jgi:hypothetical protein